MARIANFQREVARVAAAACVVSTLSGGAFAAPSCGEKLGPAAKREALFAQLDEPYRFILRGTQTAITAARKLASGSGAELAPESLEAFDSVALTLRVRDAAAICSLPGIEQVWYLHPTLAPSYVSVLSGLQYVYRTLEAPNVVNMSIGPPAESYPIPGDPGEPMHHATRKLAEKGLLAVIAIGNLGDAETLGLVNPWCRAQWVVCVGAASANGILWPKSSKGVPKDPLTWPSVVAHGVDVIGPWPSAMQKSDQRRLYDESNAEFIAAVSPDRRHEFTLMSGSSQAAAQVSRAASQIIFFVRSLAEKGQKKAGDRLFSLVIPRDRFEAGARLGRRFTGTVVRQDEQTVEIEYRLVEPWRLIKQLLIDTAIPMAGYGVHEVGAGFVSPSYVEEQFGAFGVASRKIMPVRVE